MSELSRIGVALDAELLERFDHFIGEQGYTNRSEAFRDLIRDKLIRHSVQSPNQEVVGSITLVYDHHIRLLPEKLTELQHEHQHTIISTLHVHLDHDHCLEVVLVRGKAAEVNQLANLLISTKGVKHGQATITTARVAPRQSKHSH